MALFYGQGRAQFYDQSRAPVYDILSSWRSFTTYPVGTQFCYIPGSTPVDNTYDVLPLPVAPRIAFKPGLNIPLKYQIESVDIMVNRLVRRMALHIPIIAIYIIGNETQ